MKTALRLGLCRGGADGIRRLGPALKWLLLDKGTQISRKLVLLARIIYTASRLDVSSADYYCAIIVGMREILNENGL